MLVHALLYTRTLGKQELNVESCLGTVCLGGWVLQVKATFIYS